MNWNEKCLHWKNKWNIEQSINTTDNIDLYEFIIALNKNIGENDTVVVDAGSSGYICGQGLKLKPSNRFICSGGQLDMGFGLPAAIGAALGNTLGNTILIVGDGGFHTNIQELAVIRQLNLPIKLFVLNNNGYLSIRNTQQKFYNANLIGCDTQHGLWFPSWENIATAYEIPYFKIVKNWIDTLSTVFQHNTQSWLVEVMCSEKQEILPTAALKDGKQMPLSQMYPFLSEEELQNEKIN